MSDRTNHHRVLHFAVTGVLLGGAVGCTSNEPAKDGAKGESKTDAKQPPGRVIVNQEPVDPPKPEPTPEPTPTPDELIQEDRVNEGPIKELEEPTPVERPQPDRMPIIDKRVNTQRVAEPVAKPPSIKVNPGPQG